jgi:hypothetical protein
VADAIKLLKIFISFEFYIIIHLELQWWIEEDKIYDFIPFVSLLKCRAGFGWPEEGKGWPPFINYTPTSFRIPNLGALHSEYPYVTILYPQFKSCPLFILMFLVRWPTAARWFIFKPLRYIVEGEP